VISKVVPKIWARTNSAMLDRQFDQAADSGWDERRQQIFGIFKIALLADF
jgi:hypothetical protein